MPYLPLIMGNIISVKPLVVIRLQRIAEIKGEWKAHCALSGYIYYSHATAVIITRIYMHPLWALKGYSHIAVPFHSLCFFPASCVDPVWSTVLLTWSQPAGERCGIRSAAAECCPCPGLLGGLLRPRPIPWLHSPHQRQGLHSEQCVCHIAAAPVACGHAFVLLTASHCFLLYIPVMGVGQRPVNYVTVSNR